MKRILDVIVVLILGIPATIVCLIVAIPIFLECRASPFFLQIRLGRNEIPFKLLKLRTMLPNTRQAASHEVGSDNILATGRIIRATKFDELPQLWNVLRGDMSLVGPRPGLPEQVELIAARRRHDVFTLLPGISGVSQIAGIDMSTPDTLAISDARYLTKWKLKRDLQILIATVLGRGSGDAASVRQS